MDEWLQGALAEQENEEDDVTRSENGIMIWHGKFLRVGLPYALLNILAIYIDMQKLCCIFYLI